MKMIEHLRNPACIRWIAISLCLGLGLLISINAIYQAKPYADDYFAYRMVSEKGIYNAISSNLTGGYGRYTHLLLWKSFMELLIY